MHPDWVKCGGSAKGTSGWIASRESRNRKPDPDGLPYSASISFGGLFLFVGSVHRFANFRNGRSLTGVI